MEQQQRPTNIAHFSFANAQGDGRLRCSPKERRIAICSFFSWAQENDVAVIGCTEGNRAQNGMDWAEFRESVEQNYGYRLETEALLGDCSPMSFSSQLYVRDDTICQPLGSVTLTPPELDNTRWVVRAPALSLSYGNSTKNILYCHLSLSRDGKDEAYNHLLHELRVVAQYVADGWIAFGDFNLTHETRTRLYAEQQPLLDSLQFQFGRQRTDLSFITFPHDRVPMTAFEHAPDTILPGNCDDTEGRNCVAPLDAVCGSGVIECHRYLPWYPFLEIPLDWDVSRVVELLTNGESGAQRPSSIINWASDHWVLTLSI